MKKIIAIVKNLITPLLWVIFGTALFLLIGAARENQHAATCKSLQIDIHEAGVNSFVNEEEIKDILLSKRVSVVGKLLMEVDLQHMELVIEENSFVENAEIYITSSYDIIIEVDQREPILRVINKNGVSYYIDKKGGQMPFSFKFTARVPVATGNIDCSQWENSLCNDLYLLGSYLEKDEFWKALIEQIVVTRNGEFELIPHIGNHSIILGKMNGFEGKLKKLMIFYNKGLNNVGWYKYRTINLKYKGQIVCTKY